MSEALLMVWLAVGGVALLAPAWRRLPAVGLVAAALPAGVAGYVLVDLAWIGAGLPFATTAAVATSFGLGVIVAVTTVVRDRRRGELIRTTVPGAAVVAAAAATGAALFQLVHMTRLTSDSLRYLLTADVLERTGSLDTANVYDLRMRHLVVPLLHTGGVESGPGYVASITPLLAASGLLAAGWLAAEGLRRSGASRRWRHALLAAAALLVLTTNRVGYHIFYVNGHMVFAVFLVIGVGLGWLAVVRRHWVLLWPAGLMFGALPALRPEAVITAAIFLVPFLVDGDVPLRWRWALATPYLTAALLWDGLIWPRYADDVDLGLFGPVHGNLLVALVVGAGLAVLRIPALQRLARWGPGVVAAGLASYLTVATVHDPDVMRASLSAMGANVAVEGLWGTLWLVLPLLLVGGALVAPPSHARLWFTPLVSYAIALFAYAYLRDGAYRVGTGDSGSRMLMHVVLVAAVAVTHAAGAAVADSPDPSLHHLLRRPRGREGPVGISRPGEGPLSPPEAGSPPRQRSR